MADDRDETRYDQTRHQFDELGADEQARFLIEATASTLAHGIQQAGQALAQGLEKAVRQAQRRSGSETTQGPGAAEPETAQRRRSRNEDAGSSSVDQ